MIPSYNDVLFAKLVLQQGLVASSTLQECISAQEAGRRAGVNQTLGHVLLKRGHLDHYQYRQLEAARELAARSRMAKLTVQLLLRHGRPPETTLRSYYQQNKADGFQTPLATQLLQEGQLNANESRALDQALERAWAALHQREDRELQDSLRQGQPAMPAIGPASPQPAYAYTAPTGVYPQANPYAPIYAPAPYGPNGGGGAGGGWGATGFYPQQPHYAAPPAPAPPYHATGYRPAYAPPPHHQPLPPSPNPWVTGQRQAYAPQMPPQMQPPQHQQPFMPSDATREQVAHMHLLPDWARTGERKSHPEANGAGPALADAGPQQKSRRQKKLEEPRGQVPGYEQLERLGRGKVGVVYKANDLATGEVVALKLLLPIFMENETLVERFLREAKIAASLDHPNIRKVYDGGQRGGLLYLAMEYVDGETIQDKLDRDGRVPEDEALRWVAQIARAMDHYNRRHILHRDIKPANILIDRRRRAILCDLGISKRIYEDYVLTRQGTTLGSPWYISPEQGMGTDDLDVRSDIYSLGITLFHCLTGRVPFLGGNAGVIISKHAREPLPDPLRLNPDISRQTAELILKMCAKNPADRPQSPGQLLAEVQWIRTETGSGVNTPIAPIEPPDEDSFDEVIEVREPSWWRRFLRALGLG